MKEETKRAIDGLIEDAVHDGTTAGALFAVTEDGRETFYTEHGYARIEEEKPMTRDCLFRMFSMTKPVTAVAAMVLMEKGMLDLGQPVKELIPGFGGDYVMEGKKRVPCRKQMTVLDLLNMTSGLTYGDGRTAADLMTMKRMIEETRRLHTDEAVGTVDFARALSELPRAFEPESSWRYGYSADVLGAVIECVTGERYGDWLKENVLLPMGMTDTDFYVPEEKQPRLAHVYREVDGTMRRSFEETEGCAGAAGSDGKKSNRRRIVRNPDGGAPMRRYTADPLLVPMAMDRRPAFECGGAGLVSSLDDYSKLIAMLMGEGKVNGVRILQPETVRFLTSGSLAPLQQAEMDRLFGAMGGFTYQHLLRRMTDPGRYAGLARMDEYGWDSWTGCYFAIFPHERKSMLLLEQKAECGTIPLVRKIRNVWLSGWT